MENNRSNRSKEFGDFQTPPALALEVASLVSRLGVRPKAILEPTCGKGSFVAAAATVFPNADLILGVEINSQYVDIARRDVDGKRVRVFEGDFFRLNWSLIMAQSEGPWLIVGNPPWVTSSSLSSLSSSNVPVKRNDANYTGVEAITGKSNFDISEWMLLRYLEWVKNRNFVIAVLCKVTVARKILAYCWENDLAIHDSELYSVDANKHFGVTVDACLFILKSASGARSKTCDLYRSLGDAKPWSTISFVDGIIVQNASDFRRAKHLRGLDANYQWRSGVKHDCSKVMELRVSNGLHVNGFGKAVDLEAEYIYPLLKSSGLSSPQTSLRKMIVTQQYTGEDTSVICTKAPKTWAYLQEHTELFRRRASVIYKNKMAFSIFGVGHYTFSPWKVAISGFYKSLHFKPIGPIDDRPVVFDDTVYFLSCYSAEEALYLASLLNSEIVTNFLLSVVHWEAKRPITVELLKQINLSMIASELGSSAEYSSHVNMRNDPVRTFEAPGLFQTV